MPILFDVAGNPVSIVRQTPDLTGPDGGNTTFFGSDITFFPGLVPGEPDGFPNFFGTSASAPHVAGVAALLFELADEEEVSPSPWLIYEILESTAQDLFGEGYDFDTGFGFVQAKKALRRGENVFDDLEDEEDEDEEDDDD